MRRSVCRISYCLGGDQELHQGWRSFWVWRCRGQRAFAVLPAVYARAQSFPNSGCTLGCLGGALQIIP